MDTEERKKAAETIITKAIFANTTNHYKTLFGGSALKIMDEVAFICATRFTREKMVTVSSAKVDFDKPIPAGTIAEFKAVIIEEGNTSVKVKVDVYVEEMYADGRDKAVSGTFTLVNVSDHE